MSRNSYIPLSLKIFGYKLKDRFQQFIAYLLRLVPGASQLLGISIGRIRSIKDFVNKERKKMQWSSRMRAPLYTTLYPPMIIVPKVPKCPTALGDPYPCPPQISKKSYNYWDKRSGFDSRNGFCVKQLLQFDEIFMAYIPNGRILGPGGAVLSSTKRLFDESLWTWDRWIQNDRSRKAWSLPSPIKLNVPCYVVTSNYCEGYPHWLMEALPRLYGLKLLPDDLKPTLIFPIELKPWHVDTINLLGFGDYPRIALKDQYFEIPHLFFPSYVGLPGTPHPKGCHWVVDTIKNNFQISLASERLYITRRLVKRRRVLNEDELLPILKNYGFKILEAENLSFAEQVQLFARAEAIVASHGAGLANIMFAPKGCKVLEILDRDYVNDHYYNLAGIFELDYYYQLCTSVNADNNMPLNRSCDDITINPELLETTLQAMFSNS